MSLARFVEVCNAIPDDPSRVFARGVELARQEGVLVEPQSRDELTDRRKAQEAESEADRIKAGEDAGMSVFDIADAADHGGDE